jgi:ATP-binding cassette, subfamily B, bacterial MsbA
MLAGPRDGESMLEFLPAVKSSLRYKWSIIGAVVCSLLIALLWGASISTIYPFVEIVLEGNTATSWIDERIEENRTRITAYSGEIDELKTQAE